MCGMSAETNFGCLGLFLRYLISFCRVFTYYLLTYLITYYQGGRGASSFKER